MLLEPPGQFPLHCLTNKRCYEKCMHFSNIICCCGVEGDCVVEFKSEEGQIITEGEGIDVAEGEVPEVL